MSELRPLVQRPTRVACAILALAVLPGCLGPTTVVGRDVTGRAQITGRQPTGATAAAQRGQILVKFKAELLAAELTSFRASYGLRNVGTIPALGVFVEEVTEGRNAVDVVRELQQSPLVAYAELNETVSLTP
ncbi:MAG: hypothetical protein VKQ33_07850 [Candidatus Sericytochromatia bacterium]|nr:hypothetical protein [Candidatus Sericytochromatia bacterium]